MDGRGKKTKKYVISIRMIVHDCNGVQRRRILLCKSYDMGASPYTLRNITFFLASIT